jgi:glyoxylase-like metal-dependent hydrolase (beta-lactamase superfamily II)
MNRREFIRLSLVLSAGAALARRAAAQAAAGPVSATQFQPLRRDVGIFTGRGGTIGWLASKEALAVVDTQFPDTALICLKGIPGIGSRTIDATINTHHHLDHTGGNVVFKAASRELVAHANVPKLQFEAAKRAEEQGTKIDPAASVARQVYADTTFPDVWRRQLGGEIVTAEFRGPAHTGGDAVVIFEKANVVHMGDLVFNRLYPYVDRPGGASIRGWIKSLEDSVASYPADAVYVFGHGSSKFGVTGRRDDRPRQADGGRGREHARVPRLPHAAAQPPGDGPRGGIRRIDRTESLSHPKPHELQSHPQACRVPRDAVRVPVHRRLQQAGRGFQLPDPAR